MNPAFCVSLLLASAIPLTSCSSFSKSSRDQRAYSKYLRKSSIARAEQQSRLGRGKSEMPPPQQPSEPTESVETQPMSESSSDG